MSETTLFMLKAIAAQMAVDFFPMPWKGRVGLFGHAAYWDGLAVAALTLLLNVGWFSEPIVVACVVLGLSHYLIRLFSIGRSYSVLKAAVTKSDCPDAASDRERWAVLDTLTWLGLSVVAAYAVAEAFVNVHSPFFGSRWPASAIVVSSSALDWPPLYAWAIGFALSLGVGSVLVGKLLAGLQQDLSKDDTGIRHAGRMIGFFEAFIITLLVALGQWQAIGFLIAAKAIGRIKRLEEREFSEYFLIGTLANVSISIVAGILIRKLGG